MIIAHVFGEGFRRARRGIRALARQALGDFGIVQNPDDLGIEFMDHRRGGFGRGEQRIPVRVFEVRIACFGDGRNIGRGGPSAWRC